MKGVLVPVDLFNKVVDYMGQRPYNEVSMIIEEIKESRFWALRPRAVTWPRTATSSRPSSTRLASTSHAGAT